MAREAGAFARFEDPQAAIDAEWKMVERAADDLRETCPNLCKILVARTSSGRKPSLLAVSVRYSSAAPSRRTSSWPGLAFAQFEKLRQEQEQGFAALHEALKGLGGRLEALLGEIQEAVQQTHEAVLDLQAEQRQQAGQLGQIYQGVIALQQKFSPVPGGGPTSRQPVDPGRGGEGAGQGPRCPLPCASCRSAQGNYRPCSTGSASWSWPQVTTRAPSRTSVLSPSWSTTRPARPKPTSTPTERPWSDENGTRDGGCSRLSRSTPRRFTPFPMDRYEPVRILAPVGFGVAFLCEHRELRDKVVVKALLSDNLDRSLDAVLDEARVLWKLDHPSVIRLSDCGYAVPASKSRPYFVMQYFEGPTLENTPGSGC